MNIIWLNEEGIKFPRYTRLNVMHKEAKWCIVEYKRWETPAHIDYLLKYIKSFTGHLRWVFVEVKSLSYKFKRI